MLTAPVRVAITKHTTCRDIHALARKICAPYLYVSDKEGKSDDADTHRTRNKRMDAAATGIKCEDTSKGTIGMDTTTVAGGSCSVRWDEYTLWVTNQYCNQGSREVPKDSDALLGLNSSDLLFIAWHPEGE